MSNKIDDIADKRRRSRRRRDRPKAINGGEKARAMTSAEIHAPVEGATRKKHCALQESKIGTTAPRLLTMPPHFHDKLMNREPRHAAAAGGRRIAPSKAFVEFAKSETEQSIATRFERQVELHGDRLAIKTQQGEINYRDLNRAANQIAHAILAYRGDCEEPITLLLERGTSTVAAILGALKAGKIYVPLDPSFPLARNADIVKDAAPKLIIVDHEHFALASSLAGDGAAIINIDALDMATDNPGLKLAPDRLAYILYTSGSTGQPKGVVQNHRNVLNVVMRYTNAVGLNAQDRLTLLPSASVTASVGNIFGALLNSASLFPFNVRANVSAVLVEHLRKHDITVYQSVPAVFRHLASALNGKDLFPNLRVIRLGSAPVLKSDFDLFKEHFSADCVFINGYGASEMSTVSQYCMDRNSKIGGATVPVGYPLADTRIMLLDGDGKPVETGGIGEIVLQSRYLALGYWRKPELTSKVFFDDPSCAGARLYLTGDVGRMLSDGCIEHLGRKDFQVKVRGYRIETTEIEFALLQQAQVKEAAVVAFDDECGDKRLVAYIVPAENPPVPALAKGGGGGISQVLRAHLKAKLPDYMLPSAFVVLERMPLTPNGKLDRKALPRPDSARSDAVAYAAPRTPTEEKLAAIYAEVLRLDRVGIYDNFFDLGGHSLLATQVVARARSEFQTDLPLRAIFESPTVQALEREIARKSADKAEPAAAQTPITKKTAGDSAPLSFPQQRLWFLDQFEPNSAAYNIAAALRMTGALHVAALAASFSEIVRRHNVLRTTFTVAGDQPWQVIREHAPFDLATIDLSHLASAAREAEASRLIADEARRPFSLSSGPLFRACLLKLDSQAHLLVITVHHIVSDGWSMSILYRELFALYRAHVEGKASPLAELPIQYGDYAVWQREWFEAGQLKQQLAYWKKQLEDAPAMIDLVTDHPRPTVQSFHGAYELLMLSRELTERLKLFSRRQGVTLFMTLLAALKTLLHRYSGQQDIVVGTHIAGRNRHEVESLIGFFIGTLALRSDLSGNPSFRELLARVREVALDAYANQDLPFEKLVEELEPERSLSHTPLVQVVFNMLNLPDTAIELPGLTVEHLPLANSGAKFDLTLYAREGKEGIEFKAVYNTDLFEAPTIVRLLNHYETLLESAAANPELTLSRLGLLGEAERNRLSRQRNRVQPAQPFDFFDTIEQSIPQRFQQQVKRYRDRLAVKTKNRAWTYKELNDAANRVTQALLRSRGAYPEMIALLFEHGAPMIAAMLGVLKAGKSYVPLTVSHPRESLAYMLEDSVVQALVTDTANFAMAKALAGDHLPLLDVDRLPAHAEDIDLAIAPDTIAYILYTSGSTGKPKGVVQNHRNVLHFIRVYTNNLHISAGDRLTLLASYGFDAAVMDIYAALLNGASLYPLDLKDEGLANLARWMIEHEITIYHSTPTVYRYFIGALSDETFPAMRLVVLGGEEVCKKDVDLYKKHFPPHCIFVNGLGPTESTVSLQYFIDHKTELAANAVPVGYPVAETEVLLLDEAGEPTEIFGEIAFKSPYVALGYWQKPELTTVSFLSDPQSGKARIYRTGDMGRLLPDSGTEFVGRKDAQVKIRGYRIELRGIEAALAEHPDLRDCVVIVREDDPGDKRLVAYVVAQAGSTLIVDTLRDFHKRKLPEYMLPSAIVALDRLPLTQNRKLDYKALPAPDYTRSAESFVAPRTPNEQTLAAIWAEILKLNQVGIHDNFFDLGGHSLLATRVISRVNKTFEADIQLRALFESPTVAGLSALIVQSQAEALSEEELTQLLAEAQDQVSQPRKKTTEV